MANIFGSEQTHNGSFRADDLKMTFGGVGGDGALVQQANFTLTRNVSMLYEIGSTNVYYVGNRRQGQAQLNRIVGGKGNFKAMVEKFGDMCSPDTITLEASGGCKAAAGGATYNLMEATLTTVGASVTAQEIVVTETLGFIFADLEYS
ncbi:hypothetical protein [Sphingorhabdus sp.]|uniref:hypothetical protein n=1 Tax=Sphingorhabdus sp. TaxID=1902408 RepID=UPI00333FDA6C